MILPYPLRLLCLCFASFFALNAASGLLIACASRFVIHQAEAKVSADASRFLLFLRVLPATLALLFVVGLCIPSYLRFEPALTAERVGPVCLLFGFLGAAIWFLALARIAQSLFLSLRYNRLCRLAGQRTSLPGSKFSVAVIDSESPLLAVFGLVRPRLLISRAVLRALSPEELEAALSHELAHHNSFDNAKRLLILLAPDILPFFRPLRFLERYWSQFTEWAADDRAAAGDSRRGLSLASALVRVARLGAGPSLPFLSTSLLECDRDLSTRVDRLLQPSPAAPQAPASTSFERQLLRWAGFVLAAGLTVLLLAPSTLDAVHELLEIFVR